MKGRKRRFGVFNSGAFAVSHHPFKKLLPILQICGSKTATARHIPYEGHQIKKRRSDMPSDKHYSLTEISSNFSIPIEAFVRLKEDGMIGDVIEANEMAWFTLLGHVWRRADFVEIMARGLNEDDRIHLVKVLSATLEKSAIKSILKPKPTPPFEAYVKGKYRKAKRGERILVEDLLMELNGKFSLKITDKLRSRVKVLRQAVRDEKRPKG
jgi:hypothetical protein